MNNKNLFKTIVISILFYMLLSWIIVAGNFSEGEYAAVGFNQIGLFDLFVAPLQIFNYFVVSVTKNINGYVNQVGYGNIIIAFITIGIFYGVLNQTLAYSNLVNKLSNKLNKKKELFLVIIASIFYIISSLTGLNLILFFLFPFVVALLSKLKFNKIITMFSTIGAMLLGQLSSLYNPNINGVNRVLFQIGINDNILPRIILFLILFVILIGVIILTRDKTVKKEKQILLFEDKSTAIKSNNSTYLPIVILGIVTLIILFICMYNWYYMFGTTKITQAYQNVVNYNIKDYKFMKNIFGISEQFGYWTGFTMSALLLLDTLIISFIYKIKFNDIFKSAKRALYQMSPMIFYSIISLTIIVLSLYNTNSFIYSIINNILKLFKDNQILGVFTSSLLHNFFVNDYFALTSSLGVPFTSTYGSQTVGLSLLITQIAHGIISLITPLNIYLVAGLSYLGISYKSWFKYIWKLLLLLIVVCLIVLFIIASFL